MKIQNISFKEYVALPDRAEYDYYLKYGFLDPEDIFKIGKFLDLSFGEVKDIQYDCQNGVSWQNFFKATEDLKGLSFKELGNISVFDLHKARLYFAEELNLINSMESDYLGHAASPEERQAGIEMFSSYGAFIQFDKLAGGDPLKYDAIKKLKYDLCFTKLKLEADRNEFNGKYHEIIKNKK